MWLQYALDRNDNLVAIDDVQPGEGEIRCPYCRGKLTARKGKIKVHHFAHIRETCNWAAKKTNDSNLPLFWGFDLVLSRSYIKTLEELEQKGLYHQKQNKTFLYLRRKEVIKSTVYDGAGSALHKFELTTLGKIILKKLSLSEFCEVQTELSQRKLTELQRNLISLERKIKQTVEFIKSDYYQTRPVRYKRTVNKNQRLDLEKLEQARIDFDIYCAQYRRVLQNSLYFLEIKGKFTSAEREEKFYKIGVTSKNIKQRIREIKADLSKLFTESSIVLLGTWKHQGSLEHYLKYRYENYNFPLGTLTEYFKFDGEAVLRDLQRIPPRQLSDREQEILK